MVSINQDQVNLRESVIRFARREVTGRGELYSLDILPRDLWRAIGGEGLPGLLLPREFGGLGGGHVSGVVATEALVFASGSMGLGLSLAVHLLLSRVYLRYSGTGQRAEHLTKLASGAATLSLAVSEPGVGAHPKGLNTTASLQGDFYVLNGEKTYLTNGPLADWFIVLAVTGQAGKFKRFTAFLIPRDTAGLQTGEPMQLGFFRPSSHCNIRLENCQVPESAVLGEKDSAYESIALPFRDLEEVYLMSIACGGMMRRLKVFIEAAGASGPPGDEICERAGELDSVVNSLRLLTYEAATGLESGIPPPELHRLSFAFRSIANHALAIFERVESAHGLSSHPELTVLANDLHHGLKIAGSAVRHNLRKLGDRLLSGKAIE
jgi:acyl-CoA dehydrogenase